MGGSGTGLADGGHQQHDLDGEGRLTKGRPPRPRWWWTAGRQDGWRGGELGHPGGGLVPYRTVLPYKTPGPWSQPLKPYGVQRDR